MGNLFPYVAEYPKRETWRPRSEEEYIAKLDAIAGALNAMDAAGPPDLLLACEVAAPYKVTGRDAMGDLAERLPGDRGRFVGSAECAERQRGITFGAIWNADVLDRLGDAVPHVVSEAQLGPSSEAGRPVVEATFAEKSGGSRFTVYLNHWTSRMRGHWETEAKRITAAKTLIGLLQRRLIFGGTFEGDPGDLLLAVGDFNDEPFDRSLYRPYDRDEALVFTRDRWSVLTRQPSAYRPLMYNPCWRLLGEREVAGAHPPAAATPAGSYLYREQWTTFDQVLVSSGLLSGVHPVFDETSLRIHCPLELRGGDGGPRGPSDHYALRFDLCFGENGGGC